MQKHTEEALKEASNLAFFDFTIVHSTVPSHGKIGTYLVNGGNPILT